MIRSRTISGILCLAAICAPLVIAPFRVKQSLGFVTEFENRNPNTFPEFRAPGNLMDSDWWASVSRALEDRVPYRKEVIGVGNSIFGSTNTNPESGIVVFGVDEWLFLKKSLAKDFGTLGQTKQAIRTIGAFFDGYEGRAEIFLLVAPDKAAIYPEKLTKESRAIYEPSTEQRAVLHDWFAKPGHGHRLDMWTPMRQLKSDSGTVIYEPQGSHYNSLGAMVLGRAMVDAADPSLWDDDELVVNWTRTSVPGLARMGGLTNRTQTDTRMQIRRKGVRTVELWDNDTQIENPKANSIKAINGHHSKHAINQSDTREMIDGKTLVIHDSFVVAYLQPSLVQFYSDIQFIHFTNMTPEIFRDALAEYDLIYIESAERFFVKRAIKLFTPPKTENTEPNKPRP